MYWMQGRTSLKTSLKFGIVYGSWSFNTVFNVFLKFATTHGELSFFSTQCSRVLNPRGFEHGSMTPVATIRSTSTPTTSWYFCWIWCCLRQADFSVVVICIGLRGKSSILFLVNFMKFYSCLEILRVRTNFNMTKGWLYFNVFVRKIWFEVKNLTKNVDISDLWFSSNCYGL